MYNPQLPTGYNGMDQSSAMKQKNDNTGLWIIIIVLLIVLIIAAVFYFNRAKIKNLF